MTPLLYFVYKTNFPTSRGPITDQIGLSFADTTAFLYDPSPILGDSTGLSPISFIGLVPGSIGVFQINFGLPTRSAPALKRVFRPSTNIQGLSRPPKKTSANKFKRIFPNLLNNLQH